MSCAIEAELECLDKAKRPNVGIEEELQGETLVSNHRECARALRLTLYLVFMQ